MILILYVHSYLDLDTIINLRQAVTGYIYIVSLYSSQSLCLIKLMKLMHAMSFLKPASRVLTIVIGTEFQYFF